MTLSFVAIFDPWSGFLFTGDTVYPCSRAASFTGGDVVLTQYQVATESPVYDHDHAC